MNWEGLDRVARRIGWQRIPGPIKIYASCEIDGVRLAKKLTEALSMPYGNIKKLIPAQPGWYAKQIVQTTRGHDLPRLHAVVAWAVVDYTEDNYRAEVVVGFVHATDNISNAEELDRFDEYVFDLNHDPMDKW